MSGVVAEFFAKAKISELYICIAPCFLNSCWCEVGKVRGRKTWLSIGNGCEYKHVMTHELGHAIGFWHEQSRPDRDNYLKINWENILDSKYLLVECVVILWLEKETETMKFEA